MVYQPSRTWIQPCVVASSLALSCLCSASVFAATCPTYLFSAASAQSPEAPIVLEHSAARLQLTEGLLQPQLEQFLTEHFSVDVIDWRVSAHYHWPSAFTLEAATAEEVLERLLNAYRLNVTIHANRSAVVSYRYGTKEAL